MGFFSKVIGLFSGIKNLQDEFNKHPATVAQYVLDKGYTTPNEQRDFCERLDIDYDQLRVEIKKLKSVNKWSKKLTTVWAGEAHQITFDYEDSDGSTSLKTIQADELLVDDEYKFYIKGICSYRKEQRHFNAERIKNLVDGGINTNFFDWCKTSLKVDPFSFLPPKTKSNIKQVIWQGKCPPTTFTYRVYDRERITVTPIRLISNGLHKDLIALDSTGKEKIYFVQNIETMLDTEGHKKKRFDDWVNDVLLVSNTQ
ncbi:hypothetical protein FKQ62_06170 [Vibrio sp. B1-2]|uniref:hypothetical protein n=1 Tax=Vibrio sp. B1-2 TaxID=2591465 RepID=UPI00148228D9|nr:hypothetical protein [Vibrio sp. B1-2]NNN99059.1 hypothetical protein [Vibrio sp. B1-2]